MSGVWERLIRSVRGTMKAILGHPHAFITRETLRTVFAEAVGILNSRPLCPSSDDPNDWEPITPSHLLQQRQGMSLPPGDFQDRDLHSRKQWRRVQILSNHFWARWLREYLPLLQERKKWILRRRNLAVNDLVLVVTENAPPRSLVAGPSYKGVSWQGWLGSHSRGQNHEFNTVASYLKVVSSGGVKLSMNVLACLCILNTEPLTSCQDPNSLVERALKFS